MTEGDMGSDLDGGQSCWSWRITVGTHSSSDPILRASCPPLCFGPEVIQGEAALYCLTAR